MYSAIHGTYWMSYAAISSFASAFLLARGYTNSDIGLILAIGCILSIVAQPLAADFADRTRRFTLMGLMQILSAIVIVFTVGLFFIKGKTLALSVIFVMAVAWNIAVQPLLNSLSFKLEVSGYRVHFGIARSMGSLGYAIICALLGSLVEIFGAQAVPVSGVLVTAILILILHATKRIFKKACEERDLRLRAYSSAGNGGGRGDDALSANGAVSAETVKGELTSDSEGSYVRGDDYAAVFEGGQAGGKESINLLEFVKRNKLFVAAQIGIIGIFFANTTYSNFMLQIAQSVGGDSVDFGRILAISAFFEIPAMLCYDKLQEKISCRLVLGVSAIGFTLKALCIFCARGVGLLYVSSCFNIVAFGLFMPALVYFVNSIMDEGEAVKGQALYPISNSVSAVISSFAGGYIMDLCGVRMLLLISLILCAGGAVFFILLIGKIKSKKDE